MPPEEGKQRSADPHVGHLWGETRASEGECDKVRLAQVMQKVSDRASSVPWEGPRGH